MSNCKKYEGLLKKISKFLRRIKELYILDGKLMVCSEKKIKKIKVPFEQISLPQSKDKTKLKFTLEGREFKN